MKLWDGTEHPPLTELLKEGDICTFGKNPLHYRCISVGPNGAQFELARKLDKASAKSVKRKLKKLL